MRHDEDLAPTAEELRELQRKKRVLASLVVHDLRNPLSALHGNLELLGEELGENTSAAVAEIVDDCLTLTSKALSLVSGLLDVEELEEGLLIAQRSDAGVDEFVRRVAMTHRPSVLNRGLTLSIDIEPGLTARFDVELIGRLVENLLDNAVRYAPRRGRVAVAARREGPLLVFRVGNNGPAVPESERDKIFERYYRLEERRAGARANRGLGLYFCRLAAEAHGGSIALEETEELPAVFVVRLPQ